MCKFLFTGLRAAARCDESASCSATWLGACGNRLHLFEVELQGELRDWTKPWTKWATRWRRTTTTWRTVVLLKEVGDTGALASGDIQWDGKDAPSTGHATALRGSSPVRRSKCTASRKDARAQRINVAYLPAQQACRFPKNAEMPSWASAASEFMLITSLA